MAVPLLLCPLKSCALRNGVCAVCDSNNVCVPMGAEPIDSYSAYQGDALESSPPVLLDMADDKAYYALYQAVSRGYSNVYCSQDTDPQADATWRREHNYPN